ncbi:MAG: HD domain-containing protein [Luminiphilus sp.]|nr:HD domain-containing protein [Luminiphilus sp.]
MRTVSFTAMKQGTQADYRFLDRYEQQHVTTLPDRILDTLAGLGEGLGGYQIDRLQHSLQTATRAENDGSDEEWVVAALNHDIGDDLAPMNHSALAAALIQPYVREEVHWVVEHHGLFQMAYYAQHLGQNPNGRAHYKDHPFYESCLRFCESWDQASFDPAYPTQSLEYFSPLVRQIFSREPFVESGREYL